MRPQGFIYNSKGTATDTLRAAGNSPRSPAGAGYNYYNSLALQSQQKRRIDTMNTKFDRAAAKLKENADRLQIPAEDFTAGLDFAAQFMQDNHLTDENRTNYFLLMAIASYHAGKEAQRT